MVVVDTNMLVRARSLPEEAVTVPSAVDEVKSDSGKRKLSAMALETISPSEDAVKRVGKKAEEIKSPTSEVDNQLVALALDRGDKLISDDKAVQNLAAIFDIEFESFMDEEIDETRRWKEVCPGCGRTVEDKCDVCGKDSIRRTV